MRQSVRGMALVGGVLAAEVLLGACGNDPTEITTQEIRAEAQAQVDALKATVDGPINLYADQLGEACVHALLTASRLDYEESRVYDADSDDFTKESGAVLISDDCTTSRTRDLDNLYADFSGTVGIPIVSVLDDETVLADLRISDDEYNAVLAGAYSEIYQGYSNDSDYRVVGSE